MLLYGIKTIKLCCIYTQGRFVFLLAPPKRLKYSLLYGFSCYYVHIFSFSCNKSQLVLAVVIGHVLRGFLLAAAKAVVLATRSVIQWPICLEDRKWAWKWSDSEYLCPQIPLVSLRYTEL